MWVDASPFIYLEIDGNIFSALMAYERWYLCYLVSTFRLKFAFDFQCLCKCFTSCTNPFLHCEDSRPCCSIDHQTQTLEASCGSIKLTVSLKGNSGFWIQWDYTGNRLVQSWDSPCALIHLQRGWLLFEEVGHSALDLQKGSYFLKLLCFFTPVLPAAILFLKKYCFHV